MAWQIKRIPEDFVVTELIEDRTEESWKEKIRKIHGKTSKKNAEENGGYLWFTMEKRAVDFFSAIGRIANKLRIDPGRIGYAGTKDKKAVTYQTLSVRGFTESDMMNLRISGLAFSDFRRRKRQ